MNKTKETMMDDGTIKVMLITNSYVDALNVEHKWHEFVGEVDGTEIIHIHLNDEKDTRREPTIGMSTALPSDFELAIKYTNCMYFTTQSAKMFKRSTEILGL